MQPVLKEGNIAGRVLGLILLLAKKKRRQKRQKKNPPPTKNASMNNCEERIAILSKNSIINNFFDYLQFDIGLVVEGKNQNICF